MVISLHSLLLGTQLPLCDWGIFRYMLLCIELRWTKLDQLWLLGHVWRIVCCQENVCVVAEVNIHFLFKSSSLHHAIEEVRLCMAL